MMSSLQWQCMYVHIIVEMTLLQFHFTKTFYILSVQNLTKYILAVRKNKINKYCRNILLITLSAVIIRSTALSHVMS